MEFNIPIIVSVLALLCILGANSEGTSDPAVQLYKVAKQGQPEVDCILFQAGIRLHFNYTTDDKNETFVFDVPQGANKTAAGICGNKTQTLTFSFNNSRMYFTFNRTGKENSNEALVAVRMVFNATLLPGLESNESYTAMASNLTQYECPVGKGFLCNSNMSIAFNHSTPLVRLETIDLRAEAFRTVKNVTTFNSDYTQCADDNKISNIIPIAVGAALGALVLVVLIAYLVGRKRNQRGYETV